MKIFMASLESSGPYSQSKPYERGVPHLDKETHDAYENRTWRERCHSLEDGKVFIPGQSFKESIAAAAAYLSMKIPGKNRQTYTKHFLSGVLVSDGLKLDLKKDKVDGEWLYLNADGRKGGKTRVWRCMPRILKWKGDVAYHILDELITLDIFRYHLEQSGSFIGIGRFRPQNGGSYGRYAVKEVTEV